MAKILTEENCINIDDALIPKNSVTITMLGNGVRIQRSGVTIDIPVEGSTIDGVEVADKDELFAFFKANSFKNGGGDGSTGVATVTGPLVDNTDPSNPVVNNPTWTQVSGKPDTFAPAAHTQPFTTITGVATAAQIPTLPISKISDLSTELAGKLAAADFSAVPDSVATDVAGLVADYNALLTLLRRD